jgi:hypothetical protein
LRKNLLQVATTAGQVTDTVSSKFNDLLADDEGESEDEFEPFTEQHVLPSVVVALFQWTNDGSDWYCTGI